MYSGDRNSLKTTNHRWTIEGFTVVGSNGEELSAAALSAHIPQVFAKIDYSKLAKE